MAIPIITVTPSAAAEAYRSVDSNAGASGNDFGDGKRLA